MFYMHRPVWYACEYVGGAHVTPMERVLSQLPFTDVTDLFMFIGLLVVMGALFIHAVWKVAQAIKGDD